MCRYAIPFVAAALVGCSPDVPKGGTDTATPTDTLFAPAIEVLPTAIDFGVVGDGQVALDQFTVRNIGNADLEVIEIALAHEAFSLPGNGVGFTLAPGGEQVVDVAFVPVDDEAREAVAVVYSTDPARPGVDVALTGFGASPRLRITPETHDFGALAVGCTDAVTVTLESVGTEPLVIQNIGWAGEAGLSLVEAPQDLPITLAPAETVELLVGFAPADPTESSSTLSVTSTDPAGVQTATQRGQADWAGLVTDHFDVPTDPPVDILFAVDRSASMNNDIAELNQAFARFINEIDRVTTGWQIGVLTEAPGCFAGGVITAQTPDYDQVFRDATNSGEEDPYYSERLLTLSDLALDLTGPGECNEGFVRPGALVHLIAVSDEPEQTRPSWVVALASLQSKVGSPDMLKVSGIVDVNDQCGPQDGGAGGYREAAELTGGLLLDVCDALWAERVEDLAVASLDATTEFPLSQVPVERTLQVYVDGDLRPAGWVYDADQQLVRFAGAPFTGGEHLTISYAIETTTCP